MKKLFLILFLAFAATTFANALTITNSVDYSLPITNTSYSLTELLATNSSVQFTSKQKIQILNKSLPHGDVTDQDGNVVGWWVYDNNSGVLLIYLY